MRMFQLAVIFILAALVAYPVLAQDEAPPEEAPQTEAPAEVLPEPATPAPPEPAAAPTVTAIPMPTVTPVPGPGSVLLSDNFDDAARAQLPLSSTNPQRSQGYVDGEYEVVNGSSEPGGVADVLLPGQFFDSSISVDARVVGGIQGRRAVDVQCRADGGGAYLMSVYPDDRRVSLIRRQPSTPGSPIVLINQSGVTAIRPGEAVNRLELTCAGSAVTGSVNGVAVAAVQDPNYTAGRHGLGARGSGTTARFDNLVVTQR